MRSYLDPSSHMPLTILTIYAGVGSLDFPGFFVRKSGSLYQHHSGDRTVSRTASLAKGMRTPAGSRSAARRTLSLTRIYSLLRNRNAQTRVIGIRPALNTRGILGIKLSMLVERVGM